MTENTEESPVVQEAIDVMASAVVAAGLWQSIPVLTVAESDVEKAAAEAYRESEPPGSPCPHPQSFSHL